MFRERLPPRLKLKDLRLLDGLRMKARPNFLPNPNTNPNPNPNQVRAFPAGDDMPHMVHFKRTPVWAATSSWSSSAP